MLLKYHNDSKNVRDGWRLDCSSARVLPNAVFSSASLALWLRIATIINDSLPFRYVFSLKAFKKWLQNQTSYPQIPNKIRDT